MRPLLTVVTEENLVPKLTFLERTEDEIEQESPQNGPLLASDRLEEALMQQADATRKFGWQAPTEERIRAWIEGREGRAIPNNLELGFLYQFFLRRYKDRRDSLLPEQKKVVSQVGQFFSSFDHDEYAINTENSSSSAQAEPPAKSVSLVSVQIALVGLLDQVDDKRTQLEEERPNSEEAILERDKALELLDFFEVRVDALRRKVSQSSNAGNELVTQDDLAIAQKVANEFKKWIEKNNPELVDAVMRLTPAATFLGILGMAGANMTWATPIVLAMCGGEKIVELIRKLKP